MRRTREQTTTKLPIERKGTKYIVRTASHVENSVPVLIAVRDMLKLAKTAKEVQKIINSKQIKINGKIVKDFHQSIKLFNILSIGKNYRLSFLETGKFYFEEIKSSDSRPCKVTNKKLLKHSLIQLNLHDGSNIITKEKINVNDTIYLDISGKITKQLPLKTGLEIFVISGKHIGKKGKIESLENGSALIKFKEGSANINQSRIIVL